METLKWVLFGFLIVACTNDVEILPCGWTTEKCYEYYQCTVKYLDESKPWPCGWGYDRDIESECSQIQVDPSVMVCSEDIYLIITKTTLTVENDQCVDTHDVELICW